MCHQCFNKSESRADQCRSLEGTWLAADRHSSPLCCCAILFRYFARRGIKALQRVQPQTVRLRSRKLRDDRFLRFVPLRKQRPTGLHPLHPPRLCGAQATQAAASLRISARRPTLAVPPPPLEAEMSCHSPLEKRRITALPRQPQKYCYQMLRQCSGIQ